MKITLFGVRGSLPTPTTKQEQREKTLKILHLAKEEWKKDPNGFSEEEFINHLPIPLSQDLGGNTTCVLIEGEAGEKVILDMGTGIRVLGNQLASEDLAGKKWTSISLFPIPIGIISKVGHFLNLVIHLRSIFIFIPVSLICRNDWKGNNTQKTFPLRSNKWLLKNIFIYGKNLNPIC